MTVAISWPHNLWDKLTTTKLVAPGSLDIQRIINELDSTKRVTLQTKQTS
jgi:hypothetical protein